MKEIARILSRLHEPDCFPAVLATLIRVEGSSYRRAGARLLLTAQGERYGSISGGCLEEDLLIRAQRLLADEAGQPESVIYDTTDENELVWGIGLGCNGIVEVLLERLHSLPQWGNVLHEKVLTRQSAERLMVVYQSPDRNALGTHLAADIRDLDTSRPGVKVFAETIEPPIHLAIFGAGDDAQPLVRMARELGWTITVADPRSAFATPARFPEADRVIAAAPAHAVAAAKLDARSVAVVMTHHYVHDVPLLRDLLPQELPYIGLLGPKKRADKIIGDLRTQGLDVTAAMSQRLHAPVGLDLGGDTPESVAVSVIAEILSALTGRTARPLRERALPIHS